MSVEKILKDGVIPSEFYALDFEASGLNMAYSYPIEVGYFGRDISFDALIKPYPDWQYWSVESQEIHNISQHVIMFSGLDGKEVCQRMNEDLGGKKVYVDGGMYDQMWCERLFAYSEMKMEVELDFMPISLAKAWFKFSKGKHVEHRALADARAIWNFIDGYEPD